MNPLSFILVLCFSAQDPDPLDPQKYAEGVKYQPKTAKKNFLLLKPKSELLKKRDNKISSFLNFPHQVLR